MKNTKSITIVVAVNDKSVLETNLLKSKIIKSDNIELVIIENSKNVASAYNQGLSNALGDLVMFVHQDVYIPENWEKKLFENILEIEKKDPDWAVIGVVGVDKTNKTKGTVWSVGLSRIAGSNIDNPVEAISLDELLFVVKKSSNLYFDEELPGWHMYGTDIVWEALKKKMNSYIINAPVIHNSLPIFYFDKDFKKSYFFIRKKWRKHLPIKTTCVMISRFALKFLIKNKINQIRNVKNKRNNYKRCCNPVKLAVELGYENA